MKIYEMTNKMLEQNKEKFKKHTFSLYKHLSNCYVAKFFDIEIENTTSSELNALFEVVVGKFSGSLARSVRSLVNRTMVFAENCGVVENHYEILRKIKTNSTKNVSCLTLREQTKIERYIESTKDKYFYGVLISLQTGLRLGELLALRWEDVDFGSRILSVKRTVTSCLERDKYVMFEDCPKSLSSTREIPLSKNLLKLFRELKANKSEYVLVGRNGKKLNYRAYQEAFSRLLCRLKIKHYGFHSLRHTFATRLLEHNVDIKTISELLGHSNATITLNRYVHSSMDNKRRAVNKFFCK